MWVRLDQRDRQACSGQWEIRDRQAHEGRQAHRDKPPIQENGDLQAHKAQQGLTGREAIRETAGQRGALDQRVPRVQIQQRSAHKGSLDRREIRAIRGAQDRMPRA